MSLAWLLGLVLSLDAKAERPPQEVTITYAASGLLVRPLPQIAPGTPVRFVVVPDAAEDEFDALAFTLRFGCGGPGDERPWEAPFHREDGHAAVSLPAECTGAAQELRWDLEAVPARVAAAQQQLHALLRAYTSLEAISARALGGRFVTPDEVARARAAVAAVNLGVAALEAADPDVRATVEAVVHPAPLEESLPTKGRVPDETWRALRDAARTAFLSDDPDQPAYAAREVQVEQAVAAKRATAERLAQQLELAEEVERTLVARVEHAPAAELEGLMSQVRATGEDLAKHRKEKAAAEWEVARLEAQFASVVLPAAWLATGATRVGERDRVISVDPEHGRFEQSRPPVTDEDRAWVAVANVRKPWEITAVQTRSAPFAIALGSRGATELPPVPTFSLRDPTPRFRTVLRDLGQREGGVVVTTTLSSVGGDAAAEVSYTVRRTFP